MYLYIHGLRAIQFGNGFVKWYFSMTCTPSEKQTFISWRKIRLYLKNLVLASSIFNNWVIGEQANKDHHSNRHSALKSHSTVFSLMINKQERKKNTYLEISHYTKIQNTKERSLTWQINEKKIIKVQWVLLYALSRHDHKGSFFFWGGTHFWPLQMEVYIVCF